MAAASSAAAAAAAAARARTAATARPAGNHGSSISSSSSSRAGGTGAGAGVPSATTLAELKFTLKTLRHQADASARHHQEATLWNQMHHENLKRLLAQVRRLAELVRASHSALASGAQQELPPPPPQQHEATGAAPSAGAAALFEDPRLALTGQPATIEDLNVMAAAVLSGSRSEAEMVHLLLGAKLEPLDGLEEGAAVVILRVLPQFFDAAADADMQDVGAVYSEMLLNLVPTPVPREPGAAELCAAGVERLATHGAPRAYEPAELFQLATRLRAGIANTPPTSAEREP